MREKEKPMIYSVVLIFRFFFSLFRFHCISFLPITEKYTIYDSIGNQTTQIVTHKAHYNFYSLKVSLKREILHCRRITFKRKMQNLHIGTLFICSHWFDIHFDDITQIVFATSHSICRLCIRAFHFYRIAIALRFSSYLHLHNICSFYFCTILSLFFVFSMISLYFFFIFHSLFSFVIHFLIFFYYMLLHFLHNNFRIFMANDFSN